MSSAAATKCDRCGAEVIGYPSDWGTVRLSRAKPFLETGTLDLCTACFNSAHEVVYQVIAENRPRAAVSRKLEWGVVVVLTESERDAIAFAHEMLRKATYGTDAARDEVVKCCNALARLAWRTP